MSINIELQSAQAEMLRVLLFKPRARFSELNVTGLSNDHFTWHLKRLVEVDLINKSADGSYLLSVKGKEFANRIDTETIKIEKQAKTSILIVGIMGIKQRKIPKRKVQGQSLEPTDKSLEPAFLMQERLKQPFYGYYGFVTGKIRSGESIEDAARRELFEESGLSGEFKLAGIEHKMDYDKKGNFLEDKFFYIMKVEEPKGELMVDFEGGRNVWVPKDEVAKLPNLFQDVLDIIDVVTHHSEHHKGVQFVEKKFTEVGY